MFSCDTNLQAGLHRYIHVPWVPWVMSWNHSMFQFPSIAHQCSVLVVQILQENPPWNNKKKTKWSPFARQFFQGPQRRLVLGRICHPGGPAYPSGNLEGWKDGSKGNVIIMRMMVMMMMVMVVMMMMMTMFVTMLMMPTMICMNAAYCIHQGWQWQPTDRERPWVETLSEWPNTITFQLNDIQSMTIIQEFCWKS